MKKRQRRSRDQGNRKQGRLEKRKLNQYYLLFLVFLLLIGPLAIWGLTRRTIVIDFSRENLDGWDITTVSEVKLLPDGIEFICPEDCYFLTKTLFQNYTADSSIRSEEYPYVFVYLKPLTEDMRAHLVWARSDQSVKGGSRPVMIDEGETKHLINFNHIDLRNGILKIESPLTKIGLYFRGSLTIRRIVLSSSLNPIESIQSHLKDFFAVEPLTAYSINDFGGVHINGYSLGLIVALLATVRLALIALLNVKDFRTEVFATVVVGFLILEVPFLNTLAHEIGPHFSHFALFSDKYEERRSRFGQEFADLAAHLEKLVPRNGKVFFTRSRVSPGLVESNWINFHFLGHYQPTPLRQADYIFYFHPSGYSVDLNSNVLRSNSGTQTIRVEPILVQSSDAVLLKVVHDN